MHKDSHKWPTRKRQPAQKRFIRKTAPGMICPKCRDFIMYDTTTNEYFCWRRECEFRESFDEYRETLDDIHTTLSRKRYIDSVAHSKAMADRRTRQAQWKADLGPVVYYIQFRDAIKIGTTADPSDRLVNLPWERVLMMEPGDMKVERHRHNQFRDHRIHGEWFLDCEEIRTHIADSTERLVREGWFEFRFPDSPSFPWERGEVSVPGIPYLTREEVVRRFDSPAS